MKVRVPGHSYRVDVFDGFPGETDRLLFVKRVGDGYPGNKNPAWAGTNCQEVIRVLIDRVKYLDGQIPHEMNTIIIASLRSALLAFEVRAAERHGRDLGDLPEEVEMEPACTQCGHIRCEHLSAKEASE